MAHDDGPPPGPDAGGWSDPDREAWRRRHGRPGDGRGHDRPASGPLPHHIEVPDNLAELDHLVPAVRHELRWERRRRRLRHLVPRRFRPAWVLPATVLLLTCLVAGLMVALGPQGTRLPGSTPLARPGTPPGRVGGLLPDITVTGSARAFPLRTRRPTALALLPPNCRCEVLLQRLFIRVGQYRLPLDVAMPAGATSPTRRMVGRIGNGGVLGFTDPGGRIRDTFHASGVTLVLVDVRGVVTQVSRDLDADSLTSLDLARVRTTS